jgi:uncharacterized protein
MKTLSTLLFALLAATAYADAPKTQDKNTAAKKEETMPTSPAQILQALLSKPLDLAHVKSLTTADVTYVSLSEDNAELKHYMPWTGTHKGPEEIVAVLKGVGEAWETKAFEVRDVIEQGNNVAMFGSFTYRSRSSGKEIKSPFSILAKVKDGKIAYLQFMEDTFGTSGTLGRPRA